MWMYVSYVGFRGNVIGLLVTSIIGCCSKASIWQLQSRRKMKWRLLLSLISKHSLYDHHYIRLHAKHWLTSSSSSLFANIIVITYFFKLWFILYFGFESIKKIVSHLLLINKIIFPKTDWRKVTNKMLMTSLFHGRIDEMFENSTNEWNLFLRNTIPPTWSMSIHHRFHDTMMETVAMKSTLAVRALIFPYPFHRPPRSIPYLRSKPASKLSVG